MDTYKKMYCGLFNAVTDAIYLMDAGFWKEAERLLIRAQCTAEEQYISAPAEHTQFNEQQAV